jgi:NADH-quinone oxidoreductase subunit J
MDVKTGFFYLFSVVLLFASFRVVTARNPVHAVLFLMLAFLSGFGAVVAAPSRVFGHGLGLGLLGCRDGAIFVCGHDA